MCIMLILGILNYLEFCFSKWFHNLNKGFEIITLRACVPDGDKDYFWKGVSFPVRFLDSGDYVL